MAPAHWESVRFFGRFVRNPRTVGAVAPSSRWLASAMVARMSRPPGVDAPMTIVELGSGTGAFTRAIRERLRPGDRLLTVELEAAFAEALRRRWPDVDCVCASAESLSSLVAERRLGPIHHIVSGLPFATLPSGVTDRIVNEIGRTLQPGGTFTTFHYLQSYALPPAVMFRRRMTALTASTPMRQFVPLNLPPALAVTWTNLSAET